MEQQDKNELIASLLGDHEKRLFMLEVVLSVIIREHPEVVEKVEKMGFQLVSEHHD